MDVIGIDEKDIDKALIDGNGQPVRAPRDLKAGEGFWVYMGPAEPKLEKSLLVPDFEFVLDTESFDYPLLKAKEKSRT